MQPAEQWVGPQRQRIGRGRRPGVSEALQGPCAPLRANHGSWPSSVPRPPSRRAIASSRRSLDPPGPPDSQRARGGRSSPLPAERACQRRCLRHLGRPLIGPAEELRCGRRIGAQEPARRQAFVPPPQRAQHRRHLLFLLFFFYIPPLLHGCYAKRYSRQLCHPRDTDASVPAATPLHRPLAFQTAPRRSVGEAPPLPLEGAEAEIARINGVDRLDRHPPDAVLQAQPAEPDRRGDDVAPAGLRVGLGQEPVAAGAGTGNTGTAEKQKRVRGWGQGR